MKSGRRQSSEVRIVQIDTQYVETDAVNFRAVVQSLTGKNAPTVWVGNGSSLASASAATGFLEVKGENHALGGVKSDQGMNNDIRDGRKDDVLSPMIEMNMYFKDFERLLSEFPLSEELP